MSGTPVKPPPEWPKHFPPGCPPTDARPVNEDVYRLVVNDPPTAEDMESYLEQGKALTAPPAERAGLSCALTRDYLETLLELPTFRGGQHKIAVASLKPIHGKIRRTRPKRPHHDLWLRTAHLKAAPSLFKVQP